MVKEGIIEAFIVGTLVGIATNRILVGTAVGAIVYGGMNGLNYSARKLGASERYRRYVDKVYHSYKSDKSDE